MLKTDALHAQKDKERVMVSSWDWETRVLHWTNMALIITLILLVLGKDAMDLMGVERALRAPLKRLHAYIGHVFVITFFLRVIWGFLGNEYARWRDIIPYRKERRLAAWTSVKWYLGGFKGDPGHAAGHDALASFFYIALFIVLGIQAVTGILLSGIEFHTFPGNMITGPMSKDAADALKEALGDVHEFGLWFMLAFIAAHIAGLIAHEVAGKSGLFSSMISGKKYFPRD